MQDGLYVPKEETTIVNKFPIHTSKPKSEDTNKKVPLLKDSPEKTIINGA